MLNKNIRIEFANVRLLLKFSALTKSVLIFCSYVGTKIQDYQIDKE